MSKKKIKSKNLLERYNEKQTKENIENTLLKGAVDTVAGSVIGTGLGAVTGDKAVFAGIALILAGHYVGDESGLLRLTGTSTMAYGIGKANEYKNNPDLDTPGKRLSSLKNDWLMAFHLKWKQQTTAVSIQKDDKHNETPLDQPNPEQLKNTQQIDPISATSETQETDDQLENEIDLSLI